MWIFCLSFTFDYRGEKGGPPVQMLFLGVAVLAAEPDFLRAMSGLSGPCHSVVWPLTAPPVPRA